MAPLVFINKPANIFYQSRVSKIFYYRAQQFKYNDNVSVQQFIKQQSQQILKGLSQICALTVPLAGLAFQAAAEEGVQYDPEQGSEVIKNISGVAYVALVTFFLFRLFKRRASKAKSERIAKQQGELEVKQQIEDQPILTTEMLTKDSNDATQEAQATPLTALFGALQAGGIAFLLYLAANSIDSTLGMADLPDQYTARNIAVSVRTIIRGLVWLATFIFGANSLGLLLLTVQLIIDPEGDWEKRAMVSEQEKKKQLPKISLTSDPAEVRKAFEQASKLDDN